MPRSLFDLSLLYNEIGLLLLPHFLIPSQKNDGIAFEHADFRQSGDIPSSSDLLHHPHLPAFASMSLVIRKPSFHLR